MNAVPTFPVDVFLEEFGEFASLELPFVMRHGRRAMHYVKYGKAGMPIPSDDDGDRIYALFLMTAHLIQLSLNNANQNGEQPGSGGSSESGGGTVGRVKKAMIGSVTVETDSPNTYTSTDWTYWLQQTPYGSEFLAFMEAVAPLGVYLNTRPDSVRVLT